MQAIEPGVAVPGYVVANWLPQVLSVNLGRDAKFVGAASIVLPFIRTGMTQEYADNPKVFGRWQPRMLEPVEAARSLSQLLTRDRSELNRGNFKLNVGGTAESLELKWSRIRLDVAEGSLDW